MGDGFCFDQKKTLQLSIFDTQFDFTDKPDFKKKMLKGYEKFMLDKVKGHEEQLKAIYLAGGSRGGCLVARLAQSLIKKDKLKHVKFIVQTFDGMCNHVQGEFGTSWKPIDNPKSDNPLRFALETDIKKQFKSKYRKRLCMRQILGGDSVLGIAYAFAHKGCHETKCTLPSNGRRRRKSRRRRIYYEQKWLDLKHGEILGHSKEGGSKKKIDHSHDSKTVKPMMKHFKNCKEGLDMS